MREKTNIKAQELVREIFELLGFRKEKIEEALGKLAVIAQSSVLQKSLLELNGKDQEKIVNDIKQSVSQAGKEQAITNALKEHYPLEDIKNKFGQEFVLTLREYISSALAHVDTDRRKKIEAKIGELEKIEE